MFTLTQTQAAYLAGVIDGEGHIGLVKNARHVGGSPTWDFRVHITNTKRAWLEELRTWVMNGGEIESVGQTITPIKSRLNKRPCYQLRLRSKPARSLLGQVFPFLLLKRAHAELMLQYFDLAARRKNTTIPGRRCDPSVVAAMAGIHDQLKALNARGVVPVVNPGPPVSTRVCSLDDCGRKHFSNGYCKQHYKKYIERGGPAWHEKQCAYCGKSFTSRRSDARCCSHTCADAAGYRARKARTSPTVS